MRDCIVSKATRLMRWSLVLLGLVVACRGLCAFSDYPSDATTISMDLCGHTTINTTDLTRFTNLNRLYLQSNKLATFPDVSEVGGTLRTLYLDENQITNISVDVLVDLTVLQTLGMQTNKLTKFPELSAVGGNLRDLYLDENQITDISDDLLVDLTVLKNLRLSSNKLTKFPDLSAVGGTLKYLYLDENQITDISDDLLVDLTALQMLRLSSNKLITFPDLSSVGATLRILYLDNNQITDMTDDVLVDLKVLEKLYLNDNPNLTHFPHRLMKIDYLRMDDTGVSRLPPILHENIADLGLNVMRSVDVCKCENAWLKQEGPNMAVFQYDNDDCDGQLWSNMTTQDVLARCAQRRPQNSKRVTQAKPVLTKMALSPFLLHSFERALNENRCTRKCMATAGCVSFYWHQSPGGVGGCVLIAPGSSISVSSVPEGNLPVWTYFALT